MLIIVHNGDICCFSNPTFDFKALRGFDVLEVDTAERFGNVDHGADEFFGVFGVHFDIKDIDSCEGLEQQPFAFHHRFAGQRTDVPQTKNRSSV